MAKKKNDPRAKPPQPKPPAEPDWMQDFIEDIEVVDGSSKKLPQPAEPEVIEDVLDDIEVLEGSSKKLPQPDEPLDVEDIIEDIEVLEGSSKKLPKLAEPLDVVDVEDVIDDLEVVEGSSQKLAVPVEAMAAEEVVEDVLDVEALEGLSQKLAIPVEAMAAEEVVEDVLDVEALEGSSQKLAVPVEAMAAEEIVEDVLDVEDVLGVEDVLDVEALEGSSQKLAVPVEAMAAEEVVEDVLDIEALEGSSQKLAVPVEAMVAEEIVEDVLDIEALEGSSQKLAVPVEDVLDDIEVVEGSSQKLPQPTADVLEDMEIDAGASKKRSVPVESMLAEEVDEDILDVEAAAGSSKKQPPPAKDVVKKTPPAPPKVVKEKPPSGPMLPLKPSSDPMPSMSLDPPAVPKKLSPKATALSPKRSTPTRIGKTSTPTMLAGNQEPDELADSGLGSPPAPPIGAKRPRTADKVPGAKAPDARAGDEDVLEDVLDVKDIASAAVPLRTGGVSSVEDEDILDEDILVEGGSEVDLGKKGGPSGFASGVDLIAEALESGVDLADDSSKTKPSKKPLAAEIVREKFEDPDSSAVDLGSSASLPAMPESLAGDVLDVSEEVVDLSEEEVDVTEETLDSGKLWGDDKPKSRAKAAADEADEDVLGGDVEELVDDELLAPSSKKSGIGAEGADDLDALDVMEEDDEVLVGTKTKSTGKGAVVEDVDELAEDEDLVVPKAKTKAGKSKVVVEEEEDEFSLASAKTTKGKAGKRVAVTVGAEEEEEPPFTGKRPKPPPPPRRGFLVGMVASLMWMIGFLAFVIVAGVVGVWYARPDLLKEIPVSPGDLNANKMRWQAQPQPNVVQEAQELRLQGKLPEALEKVKNAEGKEALSTRAEIHLDKYLKEKLKRPGEGNDEQAKEDDEQARKDAEGADSAFLKEKIAKTIDAFTLREELATATAKLAAAEAKNNELVKEQTKLLATIKGVLDTDDDKNSLTKEKKDSLAAIKKELDDDKAALGKKESRAVDYLLKEFKGRTEARKELSDAIKVVLKDTGIKEEDVEGVKALVQKSKDLVSAIDKELDGAKPKVKEKDVEGVKALVKQHNELVDAIVKELVKLKQVEEPFNPDDSKKLTAQLAKGLDKVMAEEKDARNKLGDKIAKHREWLATTPMAYLDNWIDLLKMRDRKIDNKVEVVRVKEYAKWLEKEEAKASPEEKAKAKFAIALAERNHDKFQEALKSLTEAKGAAIGAELKKLEKEVDTAQKELTDPGEYYVKLAKRLFEDDKTKPKALETLKDGLKAMPKNPRLLLEMAIQRLENFKSKKTPPEAEAEEVRTSALDAKQAAKAVNNPDEEAEAVYVLGQLEEWIGKPENLKNALKNYKEAMDTNKITIESRGRYRTALFKLQLRMPAAEPAPSPIPDGAVDKTSQQTGEPQAEDPQFVSNEPNMAMLVLLLTCVQPPKIDLRVDPDDPNNKLRIVEAQKQIDEGRILGKTKEKEGLKMEAEGYMLLGHAYFKMGNPKEGLKYFTQGLGMYPGKETWGKELDDWIKVYQEDLFAGSAQVQANPSVAERYFSKGLEYFNRLSYAEAEKEFKQAVKYFNRDARYHYYLGMALYQQNTKAKLKEAKRSFDAGAELEAQSRPDSVRINASLERVQGGLRQILSEYRQKALAGEN